MSGERDDTRGESEGDDDDEFFRSAPAAAQTPERGRKVYQFDFHGAPKRIDTWLASRLQRYSRGYLKQLIETGYVTIDPETQRDLKPATKLAHGQRVTVTVPPPIEVRLRPEPIPLDFLYEDEHMAVIDKPAGLAVHPAPAQTEPTLVNALLHWIDDLSGIAGVERPGIVHRLDKDTSGIMVVAKHDIAHHGLARQFKERTLRKTYQAIVRGEPEHWEGRVDLPIGRNPTHSKKMAVRTDGIARSALTDYRVLDVYRGYALVECYPKSGRTHQIRVHMAHLRLPVAADKLYGREKHIFLSELRSKQREADEEPIIARQALHAAALSLEHPVTREEMSFHAPLHRDMLDLLHALQTWRSPR